LDAKASISLNGAIYVALAVAPVTTVLLKALITIVFEAWPVNPAKLPIAIDPEP